MKRAKMVDAVLLRGLYNEDSAVAIGIRRLVRKLEAQLFRIGTEPSNLNTPEPYPNSGDY